MYAQCPSALECIEFRFETAPTFELPGYFFRKDSLDDFSGHGIVWRKCFVWGRAKLVLRWRCIGEGFFGLNETMMEIKYCRTINK
jgi:hypothetical protein